MKKPYGNVKDLLDHELLAEDHPHTVDLIRQLKHVKKKGYFTKPEFLQMCRWKSPRSARWCSINRPQHIEQVARAVLATSYERRRIELLTSLKGVSIPTASAILTLIDPKRYGVIDIRVWQLLHGYGAVSVKPGGQGFTFDNWYNYLTKLRYSAKMFNTSARMVEWTLFICHKSTQKGTLYKASSR